MKAEILVRSEGIGKAKILEEKILRLKDDFAKEDILVYREVRKSYIETASFLSEQLIVTIIGTVIAELILKLIDSLLEDDTKNVNININIKDSKIKFTLPEDKQKILDYFKKE